MKPFKKKWNLKYTEAFTIDWHKASSEVENIMNDKKFINHSFDHRLIIANLYMQIKNYERSNNVDEYLKLLDQNRNLIKGES